MYLNLGKKDLVEPAIQILSSAYIPTMTYIYSDESLLDQVRVVGAGVRVNYDCGSGSQAIAQPVSEYNKRSLLRACTRMFSHYLRLSSRRLRALSGYLERWGNI